MGFQLGSFPAKFLGVPLITTKLSLADCLPLIHRIQNRIASWTSRFLSYAGRLQLLKSVIFAIQNYWASLFILPAAAIKHITSLMSKFLWNGPSLQSSNAKVAWKKISLPLSEGGLDIKQLTDWNKALILWHLWNVVRFNSTSSWASWAKMFNLKGKNFWIMPIPADCSWIWRKVLQLRPLAKQLIQYKVGNGKSISLWFDPWISNQNLASSIHDPLILNSGLSPDAKVSKIISFSNWVLPQSNHTDVIEFRRQFDFNRPCNSNSSDAILWENSSETMVKVYTIWQCIRQRGQIAPWSSMVWHKMLSPRHSFHLWLAHYRALRTKDKLLQFGIDIDPICGLCNIELESFDHLFFECPFSYNILFRIMRQCGWRGCHRQWNSLTSFISSCQSSSLAHCLLNLGFAEATYAIWKERNARIFKNSSTPARTIVKDSMHLIKCKLQNHRKTLRKIHASKLFHLIL